MTLSHDKKRLDKSKHLSAEITIMREARIFKSKNDDFAATDLIDFIGSRYYALT
jgi:hypothetical protein